jgi:hypothetical protein
MTSNNSNSEEEDAFVLLADFRTSRKIKSHRIPEEVQVKDLVQETWECRLAINSQLLSITVSLIAIIESLAAKHR